MGYVTLTCERCGSSYERHDSQAEGSKYCSRSCQSKETIAKIKRVEKECDTCGAVFEVQQYRSDTARFCSHQCRADWQSVAYRGSNAPNYDGGKAELYDGTIQKLKWHKLADIIRSRDKYRCRSCGMANEECLEEYGNVLDVHHIKRPHEFNNPADAHNEENLITLCKSCHSTLETTDMTLGDMVGTV